MNRTKKIVKATFFLSLMLLLCNNTYAKKKVQQTEALLEQTEQASEGVELEGNAEVQGGADGTPVEISRKNSKTAAKNRNKKSSSDLVDSEGVFVSKSVKNSVGDIKLFAKGTVGSVQLYALNHDDKAIPVYAMYDEFTSTHFCVMAGKKVYTLTNNAGIVIGARKSDLGVQMVYAVPNLFRLIVKYDCLKSSEDANEDIVKVTATVKNKGKRTEIFGLKQNIDTYLGEQAHPHFSTADSTYVDSEVQYRKLDKVKFVQSGNKYAKAQFIFDGADVSRPEAITLANKDMLLMNNWIPSAVTGKNFDSVISYNNSAIGVNWESVRLAPQEEVSYVYYIALATDGLEPKGLEFIDGLQKKMDEEKALAEEEQELVEKTEDKKEEKIEAQGKKPLENKPKEKDKPSEVNEKLVTQKVEPEKVEEKQAEKPLDTKPIVTPGYVKKPVVKPVEEEKIVSDITVDPEDIPDEKLNPDYIQSLLDRINDLEAGDDSVDRKELIMLNAELDAILMKLGSQ